MLFAAAFKVRVSGFKVGGVAYRAEELGVEDGSAVCGGGTVWCAFVRGGVEGKGGERGADCGCRIDSGGGFLSRGLSGGGRSLGSLRGFTDSLRASR
ncbi:hypothetical protein EJ02DRAFT_89020 [Clathrospora elynae]|uniref:Uncharacterized protein n=1 Tax=Clathrospora elynae TaxID=706981 RepID=A0A6A5T5H3_9PLEO|nr:hypothetical protein EJ02DRAFT_89020 [Clathrospora elynae]